jgi:small subunit ribosomal protein S16
MSVSIKLSRYGAKNSPFYRVVAMPTRSKRDGKNLEILGNYDPKLKKLVIDQKKLDVWIKNGAILTEGFKKVLSLTK